jgi:hypothetical protein
VLPLFVNASLGEGILTFFPFEANIEGSIVNSTPKKKKRRKIPPQPPKEKRKKIPPNLLIKGWRTPPHFTELPCP